MCGYTIVVDSGGDLPQSLMKEWGLREAALTFVFNDDGNRIANSDLPVKEFYERMRNGEIAKTAAVSLGDFTEIFEDELQKGNDVLYLGFSSGISTTVDTGELAAAQLRDKYPDRKIIVVDTLCASAGCGLAVYLAVKKRDEGATIDEVADYERKILPNIVQWFTVEDLEYLKRGGRVSAASAALAGALNIKPVLHVDDEGHLINMMKVRGRKKSIKALADKYGEVGFKDGSPIFIGHGDCLEDAQMLVDILKERYGVEPELVTDIGPVIGAHSGPGTVALFFVGSFR